MFWVFTIAAGWLACGLIAYGLTVATYWESFPTLQKPGRIGELASGHAWMVLGGPLSLLVAVVQVFNTRR